MRVSNFLLLLLPVFARSSALDCTEVPGSLKQIDASNGQVFGVNSTGSIFTLYGNTFVEVPGSLKHVTVGPAGVWGVNNNIYKLVGGTWQQVSGALKQIDAGGDQFVVGANAIDDIYCLHSSSTISVKEQSSPPWVNIAGKLKYYSCGLRGCWGVNSDDYIYFRHSVTPESCAGSRWEQIDGRLSMIEVGTDGSVYGVSSSGEIFRRDGITNSNPVGTTWTQILDPICKCKHVSYDLGLLWIVSNDGTIVKCRV
ncbi:fish-egg lectin-like [Alligator mississippiensis]|uniref:fish-egg lectin-like n=1 Tax=Alligator mississippiensis TaxID=8496 RepID=UPI002877E71A|nr:fish-egg lectin-like [Alligator mississippiensis]